MIRRSSQWGNWIAIILLLCPSAGALAQAVGTVTSVVGDVEVVRSATEITEALTFQDPIYLSDLVRTAQDSHTKLLLRDESILKIGPSSELLIDEQLVGLERGDRTIIKLFKGQLRSLIGQRLQRVSGRFEVHTSVAVALVRGTDFEVWSKSPTETIVRTYEGSVEVYNIDPDVRGSLIVGPNTYTVIGIELPPTPLQIISPQQQLQEQFDSKEEGSNEKKLRTAEEGQIADPDASETSSEGQAVRADIALEARLNQLETEIEPLSIDEIVDDEIYGQTSSGQLQTVQQPDPPGGTSVPIQFDIPTP